MFSYGNSELRGGVTKLSPKQGVVILQQLSGSSREVYTATPGIPGDSGSGFLNSTGQAIGVHSTVAIAPTPGSNGVGDLSHELNYLHAHSSFTGVNLMAGTEPFHSDLANAITKS